MALKTVKSVILSGLSCKTIFADVIEVQLLKNLFQNLTDHLSAKGGTLKSLWPSPSNCRSIAYCIYHTSNICQRCIMFVKADENLLSFSPCIWIEVLPRTKHESATIIYFNLVPPTMHILINSRQIFDAVWSYFGILYDRSWQMTGFPLHRYLTFYNLLSSALCTYFSSVFDKSDMIPSNFKSDYVNLSCLFITLNDIAAEINKLDNKV